MTSTSRLPSSRFIKTGFPSLAINQALLWMSAQAAVGIAAQGWDVVAVEPAAGLRQLGQGATRNQSIHWIDDQLPDLGKIRKLSYRFDLILVSAVWMHIPPSDRERAFRILTELLAPDGMLVITLRHGPGDGERLFYDVSREELEGFAKRRALIPLPVPVGRKKDELQRSEVSWETLAFRLADDGTGTVRLLYEFAEARS